MRPVRSERQRQVSCTEKDGGLSVTKYLIKARVVFHELRRLLEAENHDRLHVYWVSQDKRSILAVCDGGK